MFFARKKPTKASPVRARYGDTVTARLLANPAITRAKSDAVQLFYHPDFLTARQCNRLCAMIDSNRRPSTVLTAADPDYRTSDSCDMDRWSPDVQPTDEAIAALLGLDPVHGETMQGQRYGPGQQFRAHCDWFSEDQPYWPAMQQCGGQRTWTAMIYLNDVAEGGATWFPLAGVRVNPRRGMLIAWNNMNADGSPNDNALHEGVAVMQGTKYIVTKWFREGPWIKG